MFCTIFHFDCTFDKLSPLSLQTGVNFKYFQNCIYNSLKTQCLQTFKLYKYPKHNTNINISFSLLFLFQIAIHKNLPILKNHFRKHWQERVKVHLDQAGKKASRRSARAAKAAKVAPKPVDLLRPVVRCPTIKYNRKVRAGRGFTVSELKAVGYSPKYARTIGIAVDTRRVNRSVDAFDVNVARLQKYKDSLIIFDKNTKPSGEQVSVSATFPVEQAAPESTPRAVVVPEQSAYRTLRLARSEKRYKGIRAKRAAERAEAEAEKKK